MKVLFTTVAAYGHLHPLMPLALAASAAGDDVLVATGANMADWVTSCGVAHAPAGRGPADTWSDEEVAQFEAWGAMRSYHLFTTFHVPPMARDLLALCRDWNPDLIVHEETEFAGPLVARLLGLPCVTQSYTAPARPKEQRATQLELLAPVWAEFTADEPRLVGDVYLDACPAAFQTEAVELIDNARAVRPVGFDGPPGDPPPWLGSLPRPAAYVTFGTVAVFSRPEVIQQTIDAVAPLVPGLVVTTGPNPARAVSAPAGAVVEPYLRQSLVLGAVDVVVSHGGAGTTLGAIEHGLPHVVMPQQPFSQLRNAEQVEALQVGRHVPQDAYDRLAPAVSAVLADERYGARVREMRASFEQLPSPDDVIAELRQLQR